MSKLQSIFPKSYPLEERKLAQLKLAGIFSALVFLFLLLLKPFGNSPDYKTVLFKMKKLITQTRDFLANQLHIIIGMAAFIIICFFSTTVIAQDSIYSNYLAKNSEQIKIGGSNKFAIFNEAFYSNQVFLVSESHGYAKPQQLDAEIFMQLNKKNGVHHYIAEVDFSQAFYLNKYLNTGNEAFLGAIYQHWYNKKAQWGNKTGFERWRTLYQYNLTLSKNKKIVVIGLDEAQDLNMNQKLLEEIVSDAKYKKGKSLMLDSLLAFGVMDLNKDSVKVYKKFIQRMVVEITQKESSYQNIFKKSFFDFQFIINNIASKKGREEKILYNFNVFYNQYKLANKKMYGFWGRFHAMQDSINGDMSFAAMLKKSKLPLAKKIISIPVYCVESASMLPTQFLPPMAQQKGTIYSKSNMVNDDSFVYKVDGIQNAGKFVGKNENVIFKLIGNESPYNKGLQLLESSSKFDKNFNWIGNKQVATTDYFQYLIVVRNSDWAIPFGDNKAN